MIAAGKPPKNVEWKNDFQEPPPPQNSELPDLPGGWVWTTCGVIADAIDPQPSHRTPTEYPGGVPYIGMGDVTSDGELDRCGALKVQPFVLKEHQERYTLHEGDFFVGKIGTLGKPVRVSLPYDYALSANIVLIQPVSLIDARFPFYWMASPVLERMLIRDSRATTQAAFGIKRFRTLPCPLPPLAEQQRIANEIERRVSAIAAINRDFQSLTARSARLRQSILKTAFSGQLVPQHPNDEPASVLLERIRAERAAVASKNENQKAGTKAQNNNGQRRRRITRLAQPVRAGKGAEK
jgi:type I restriction enzyme S subunit